MKEYIEFKETGICNVQIDMVIKKFTLLNRISQYGDEFYLLEYTPKCKRKLKVEISAHDAMEIIEKLKLKPFRDDFFKKATTYVPTT